MRYFILFFIVHLPKLFFAQLKTGQVFPNVVLNKIVSHSSTAQQLYDIKSKIIILDFFGTWCAPCIKAIPDLINYQKILGDSITTLLISIEKPEKLTNFVTSKKIETLTVIAEEEKHFHNIAMPPSYPYTLILNDAYQIIEITNTSNITIDKIRNWMQNSNQKQINLPPMLPADSATSVKQPFLMKETNTLLKLSQDFMYGAKSKEDVSSFIQILKTIPYNTLVDSLPTDDLKKVFWINLYNAFVNSALQKNKEQYKKRNQFFKAKNIEIAGHLFSLDDIEHGILRRSKIKWSLGYLNKLFPSTIEKKLRVNHLDYRIHFALNCGAKSCPPIAFYNSFSIEQQLTMATQSFLMSEAEWNEATNKVYLPAILSWFRRDFGGKKKIISLLKEKKLVPQNSSPKIHFKKYDWSITLDNYKTDM